MNSTQVSLPGSGSNGAKDITWVDLLQPFTVAVAIPGAMVAIYQLVMYLRSKRYRPDVEAQQVTAQPENEVGSEMQHLPTVIDSTATVADPLPRSPFLHLNPLPTTNPTESVHVAAKPIHRSITDLSQADTIAVEPMMGLPSPGCSHVAPQLDPARHPETVVDTAPQVFARVGTNPSLSACVGADVAALQPAPRRSRSW